MSQAPTPPPWPAPEPCNVAAALTRQARERPDAAAIHFPVGRRGNDVRYQSFSYAELDRESDAVARGLLAMGIRPGERAALMVPPGREFFVLFFALFKAGIVPVLIDPGIGPKHLKQCLGEAAPDAFIGITRAQLASVLLRWSPATIRHRVTVGPRLGWGGQSLARVAAMGRDAGDTPALCTTGPDDLAAILFTSGSTGPPKGVIYRHRQFHYQVEMLRDRFDIQPGEVDLATFPPFALFDPALGMTTVVPYMDPTRPARADPALLLDAIRRFGVTNVFGSPALLRNLGLHLEQNDETLDGVRRVLSAGAAVPTETVRRVAARLPDGARVHTPYGATECLPVASIDSAGLDDDVIAAAANGEGICVGTPVAPNLVFVMAVTDEAVPRLEPEHLLETDQVGEIIVHGPTATPGYWHRDSATERAVTVDGKGRAWHRMGDIGRIDEQGRIWFMGRKSQRVRAAGGDLYTDQLEAIFNTHPEVARTALVGVGASGEQRPVLCVEPRQPGRVKDEAFAGELRQALLDIASERDSTRAIATVLFHPGFPVDIRHNSKIGRETLATWAAGQLGGGSGS
ncbi:AMP-binding protein [Marinihelvus fidelis]|uniref:AMP-binding protein n=1 Tax=Marinihelvus fidelis TaxID=2613842 RepID=A0A5N0T7J3_9GAMM|nr:fatty acid CoA ligase family protein [Marinihelvus fidelis]KAA9130862.1 AMP-binding protein [Marinihelvus fidelis]